MSILLWISSQILSLQGSVHLLEQRIEERKKDLARLQQTATKLTACKSDFVDKKSLCMQPELGTTTWHGELATAFDNFRKEQLHVSYMAIPNEQMNATMGELQREMKAIEEEIAGWERTVSSLQTNIDTLFEQKREELTKE
ncbi:YwqH-like family protein [Virgibacillus halodenitrificans]|uniref:DUF5082 family protein n=1 Tax=Virgibacillus halodenitrificans TaxID=1482 RepID=A0ABR7VJS3_VIRHA|nr:DUF5082 family protein [Virgibacillus halodenitrificans]MBD1221951.1 DUF5082 family protein [Virgibacillus halodenitrificans]